MKVIFALMVGMALGAAGLWLLTSDRGQAHVQAAGEQVENAARATSDAVQEKLRSLNLNAEDVKEELARTGNLVRRKAGQAGQAIADATADARITAAIKGKLLASRELSAWSISVNTTEGVVTLSGSVPSAEAVGRAVLLALDTEGVREVISTLLVRAKAGAS